MGFDHALFHLKIVAASAAVSVFSPKQQRPVSSSYSHLSSATQPLRVSAISCSYQQLLSASVAIVFCTSAAAFCLLLLYVQIATPFVLVSAAAKLLLVQPTAFLLLPLLPLFSRSLLFGCSFYLQQLPFQFLLGFLSFLFLPSILNFSAALLSFFFLRLIS
ncbi:hypothetical protein M9H77_08592 [Catharanthus roseus]|uniref:Uncharacterized protein n=1 Tax=Catharanthus roseus TaxID=4058 RepID=A0ACC0BYE9_CATRO|nr:hypothetical protein M9H77_08592 [Catharanthus roseus]